MSGDECGASELTTNCINYLHKRLGKEGVSSHDASPAAVQTRLYDVSASEYSALGADRNISGCRYHLGSFGLTGTLPVVHEVSSKCPSIYRGSDCVRGKARTVV